MAGTSVSKIWVEIPSLPGYRVSDDGDVRSRRRVLKQFTDNRGFQRVKAAGQTQLVHLLVLRSFIGPRPEGAIPVWENGNRRDNRLANVLWDIPEGGSSADSADRCSRGHRLSESPVWGRGKYRICVACRDGHPPVVDLPEVLK